MIVCGSLFGTAAQAHPPVISQRKDYEIHYSIPYSRYESEGKERELKGDFYQPAPSNVANGANGDPLPVVLLLHGGGWRTGSKTQMLLHAKKLAKRGYAAFAVNYRLAPKHKFPAQAHDAKAAVRWLRKHAEEYNIDPNRIVAYGYSAGAHMACLLGTTDASHGLEGPTEDEDKEISTRVQVVVGGGSPCDFRGMPPNAGYLNYWLGGTRADKPRIYDQASPAAYVSADDPPTFFFHGDEDWLVPIHSPQSMQRRLNAVGVRTGFHVCPCKGHVNTYFDAPSIEAAIDFIDSVLQPEK